MNEKVNPEMLILAREILGLTQKDLAALTGLTQATISRYESKVVDVPNEHVDIFAKVLRRPSTFFFWKERTYGASCLYHRARKKISSKELKKVHAQVNILRIQAARLLHFTEIESKYSFCRLNLKQCESASQAAKRLRHLWQLPMGPVRSVVGSIERAGGIVFRCPFETVRVDGISQWPIDAPEMPPVFFVNVDSPGDRQRWTLAHEIGHIVLHHLPTDNPEDEADEFAGEFLLPADEVASELRELTLQKAAALKSCWRVSMQAIIRRARQLGKISDDRYQRLFQDLSAKGYRKCEPVPLPAEEPKMLEEMQSVIRAANHKSDAQLSELMGMLDEDYRAVYGRSFGGLRLVG